MGCVYMARNAVNGKVYIGKTICSLEKRKKEHKSGGRRGGTMAFSRAIAKYGFESFEWSKLFESNDNDELLEQERRLIKEHNSNGPEGYNTTNGGESGWVVTKEHSESISRRMKSAMAGSDRRMSLSNWSKLNGHRISEIATERYKNEEYKQRHGDITRSVCKTDKWKKSVKLGTIKRCLRVECVTTGQFFISISEACRYFRISSGSLLKNARKYSGRAYGRQWIFHNPLTLTNDDDILYTFAGGTTWTLSNYKKSLTL